MKAAEIKSFVLATLYALLLTLLLYGCATQKRCARKWPAEVVRDTVRTIETIEIAGKERISIQYRPFTVLDTITEERVRLQVHTRDSLVYIDAKCPPDTSRSRSTLRTVERVRTVEVPRPVWWPVWLAGALLLAFFLYRLLK